MTFAVNGFEGKWTVEDQLNLSGLVAVPKPISKWKTFQLPEQCFTGDKPLAHIVQILRCILKA